MNFKKPILVTGSHRSGTTWIGNMISTSPEVFYIGEPFNPNNTRVLLGLNFEHWFKYISVENEDYCKKNLAKLINLDYDIWQNLKSSKNLKDFRIYIGQYRHFLINKIFKARPLLKDPIAVFSAEWLAQRFNMNVLVVIRHPAAFVGSLKKASSWKFSYTNFLEQPLLMSDYLYPFENEIKKYAIQPPISQVENGILLWKIIYSIIAQYQEKHKDWLFIRHEDISRNPVSGFREIYKNLELKYTDKIQRLINSYSNYQLEEDVEIGLQQIKRNSYLNISSWKNRLTVAEIEKIREETYCVAKLFYSDEDWD